MPRTEPEGLLLVDKSAGPTSHDVVDIVRRALRTRRVGHTGTLDPFASGLLLILVGRATRLAEYFDGVNKHYRAVMQLGVGTDTDDRTGTVVATAPIAGLDEARVRHALESQAGERMQRPPAYSAKKVAGARAYEVAREGRPLDLAPVRVRIESVRVERVDLPDVWFETTCGSGTYIRAIARDAGVELGVPAHLRELRRTAIGLWSVDDAIGLDAIAAGTGVRARLLTPAQALAHLERVEIDAASARRLAHGLRVPAPDGTGAGPLAVVSDGALIAVAEGRDGELAPRKVLANG